ncbi:MAG: hypothetical protein K2X77_15275 [Candidatus Obscuribacterales bacterium]|nr:hypothetical protein [Candidatus Obscuribacterales bacterium]
MTRFERRKRKAQSLLETVMGISFLVPIFLLLVDFTLVFAALQKNDSVCRNVVRTAASGAPEDANNRAQAILAQKSDSSTGWFSKISLAEPVALMITNKPNVQLDPESNEAFNPGGPIEGSAIASTQITIKPILLHLFHGERELTFKSQQSCPISYVMPESGRSNEVKE